MSEGITDLETQKVREQIEQSKFEAECKRRDRKSLREQLRSNAINKQKEYHQLVKEKDGFNRLSQAELDFFQKIEDDERQKEEELQQYLKDKGIQFEQRKSEITNSKKEVPKDDELNLITKKTGPQENLNGIIKKKNKPKIKMKLKKLP